MENLLRVDFESNRVERTREEWIKELIKYQRVYMPPVMIKIFMPTLE
jgi:hypothetical protein